MNSRLSRRDLLRGSLAVAALALADFPWARFGLAAEEGETLIPFTDAQPVDPKRPMVKWEDLKDWITPTEQVFAVSHYGTPTVDIDKWRLEIGGLVGKPKSLALDDLKARKKQEVTVTLECSGNSSGPGFLGAVANVRFAGTPLAPLLHECDPLKRGIEVVFFGADEKTEKIREKDYLQNFARSLAVPDALKDEVLLAWEMNGQPLAKEHGAPVRLIVPGWFAVAWVKWLSRIEVLDRRFMNRFMARDYVSIRGEEKDGKTIWRETSVGPIDVKSIVARAVRRKDGTVRFSGAAWADGAGLKKVEVQINGGAWQPAQLVEPKEDTPFAWRFFTFDWKDAKPGEHTVVARAIDAEGRVQPAADDPAIKLKRTYWEANQQYPRRLKLAE